MINLADAIDGFQSCKKRLERFAVDHMRLRAPAEFTRKFVKRRLKIILAKEHAWQFEVVQLGAKPLGIDKWCAEDFEWSRGTATFGNVRALEQTHTRVNGRSPECRYVW
jgi:hypothetical protein